MKKLLVGLILSVVAIGAQAAVRELTPTNTTADIQAAIDAVSAAGGGEVRFEKGVYRLHGYEIRPSVAHCAIKNLDLSVFRNSGAYSNDLNTTTNPQVTIGKVRVDGARYTTALLKRGTPFADKGVVVYEKNNVCYFYDTDAAKWRNARLKTTVTAATVAGSTPLVDFVGDPQVEGRVPYAPYYLNPTGLKLLVR